MTLVAHRSTDRRYNSLYSTVSPDFDSAAKCEVDSGTLTLVPATALLNIDNDLPWPYTVD